MRAIAAALALPGPGRQPRRLQAGRRRRRRGAGRHEPRQPERQGDGDRVRLAGLPDLREVEQRHLPGLQGQVHRHRQGALRAEGDADRRRAGGGGRLPAGPLRRQGQVLPGGRRGLPPGAGPAGVRPRRRRARPADEGRRVGRPDRAAVQRLHQRRRRADGAQRAGRATAPRPHNIDVTPTFVINGKPVAGDQDMAAIDKAITDAEAAAK